MVAEAARGRKPRIPAAIYNSAPRAAKALLVLLWEFAPWRREELDSVFVYPRPDDLAFRLGATTRSVYRHLAALVAEGFVERATQSIAFHAKGEPDRIRSCAGFVLHAEPTGRREEICDEEIEAGLQLDLWSVESATDRSVTDLGQPCHSASYKRTSTDPTTSSSAPACTLALARVAHDVPTQDDDDRESTTPTPSQATDAARTTSTHAGTTTTIEPVDSPAHSLPTGLTPSEGTVPHATPTATPTPAEFGRSTTHDAPQRTTTTPDCGRPPPYLHRPLALWEMHEKLRCQAKVGGPHRQPPNRAALVDVIKLRDHVSRVLGECDEELAWRALDCYVRGAVRLAAEAAKDNRRVAPMLATARCDGREWATDRFDKTWPHVERVEWKSDQVERMALADKARTEEILAERRAWENDPARIDADRMAEVAKDVLGPMGLNRWKIGVAAGAVSPGGAP